MIAKDKLEIYSGQELDIVRYSGDSRSVVVWFGGINEPFMSRNFAHSSERDFIMLRDSKSDWYTSGVSRDHNSVDEGIAFLNAMLSNYDKKIFCGQSSGGYAALLYSWHCNADLCLPFAPQTANMFGGQCAMVPHVRLDDVARLHVDEPRPRIVASVSRDEAEHERDFFWDDWRHVQKLMQSPRVVIVNHPYHAHAVTVRMHGEGRLYRFIEGMISIYA